MPKTYHISKENVQEIRKEMQTTKNKNVYRRLEAVALRGEGKSNHQSAEITRYHPKRVSQLVALYCNKGLDAIASDGRKGGNHHILSYKEEQAFLKQFEQQAESGQIITISEIKKEYDNLTGNASAVSTVYYMLAKHGWRKLLPRSKHPKKASDEAIEASKKLTQSTKN